MREILDLTIGAASGPLDGRVVLDGEDFLLNPEVALALSLIVHELTTNAIKYGALSNDRGQVQVVWKVAAGDECDVLSLTWRERGGPPVQPPEREGFGTRLIRAGISSKRGKRVDLRFEPSGLVCELEAMLDRTTDRGLALRSGISSPAVPT